MEYRNGKGGVMYDGRGCSIEKWKGGVMLYMWKEMEYRKWRGGSNVGRGSSIEKWKGGVMYVCNAETRQTKRGNTSNIILGNNSKIFRNTFSFYSFEGFPS